MKKKSEISPQPNRRKAGKANSDIPFSPPLRVMAGEEADGTESVQDYDLERCLPDCSSFSAAFDLSFPDESDFNRTIGARLKALRQDEAITQADLADILGVPAQEIVSYENGLEAMPMYKLALCACYFEVALDYFVDD